MYTSEDLKIDLHEDIVYLMQMKKKYTLPYPKKLKSACKNIGCIIDTTIQQLRDQADNVKY